MAVKWTKEQEQVIGLRNRNILVSAAAGSGKTAVLVQRILGKVMDPEHPVDIDRLLIMTFTRAAAGEMRERIANALEDALGENPENEHLQRQTTLIHTAQITTIDGFCAYVIRNYFHLIGLDPGYRTGEEGELKLLQEDVMKELLEAYYAKDQEKYKYFIECYAAGKSDEGIRDLIYSLYHAAMSNPYPDEWLEKCIDSYKNTDIESIKASEWMKLLWKNVLADLEQAKALAEEARKLCFSPGGPYLYDDAISSDLLLIRDAQEKALAGDFDGTRAVLGSPAFARLSTKKPKEPVDDLLKEQVKALRENEKDILKDLGSRYFTVGEEELPLLLECCREPVEMLVELTREFIRLYGEKKREKNILDFTDMEHFALEILMERVEDEGEAGYRMSQAARELSMKYDEVMVDEYQDSNLVQEMITTCVSGWAKKSKNIFMVGDVKQSIYRFRLARPELFMEKYKKYTLTDSGEQRIDLHKNFRSRSQVLSCANFIFRQIMGEDLGGIAYDEAAALYPGAVFPEGARDEFLSTEVLLVEKDSEELEDLMEGQDARELEALAISHRIQEMVGKEKILDKETGEYRPVRYGDIVILLRTASGWSETFTDVLSAHGIPVYAASKTGYFSALEVVTVLNYLQVCDNPLQDIPLAGVLRSPLAGCTTQELAVIREEDPEGMLYESVLHFLGEEETNSADEVQEAVTGVGFNEEIPWEEEYQTDLFDWERLQQEEAAREKEKRRKLISPEDRDALQKKLRGFISLLNEMRDLAVYTPVHELILEILRRTGYGNYAKALPNGAQRSANLAMLVEKAMDYEKTSYRGLFNFVRYIEHLQKYEVDYGEVNLSGAGEGSVEIMTIHKSKGLEFPVVILAGMGKQFNFQDLNAKLLIHPDYGLGADAILPDRRMVVSTLNKQVIRRQLLEESLGEEIRVLYVALTRAKEKMILTGAVSNLDKELISLSHFRENQTELLPAETRLKGKNYLDYVLPALARHRCMDSLYEKIGLFPTKENPLYEDPAQFQVKRITAQMLTEAEVVDQATGQMEENLLEDWDSEKVMDPGIREELDKRFGFVYPYEYRRDIPVKVTVSDLKKKSYHEDEEIEEAVYFEPDIVPLVPRFIEEKTEAEEEFTGAARGTAYHRVMECLEYGKTDTSQNLKEQIEELVQNQKLSEVEAKCVRVSDIRGFVECDLGQRMKAAALKGRLFREQPFVISRSAAEIDESWDESERVLVQGIIDAYFLEDEEIVLVDYKTDYVRRGEEKKLIERYHTQLEDYGQALERMTRRRVKEKYIYSFALKKAILL
ncbi:MAG TPA: helicase-exonuclease AddAB subunit AddA [Blautia sp.]|nr:aTP-dependent helicase/nuclease subunit A [Ruminococcus sp. CAG:60]HCL09439.1 helicase-exonuclease AddAB subunit AddA [Blautia sp.]